MHSFWIDIIYIYFSIHPSMRTCPIYTPANFRHALYTSCMLNRWGTVKLFRHFFKNKFILNIVSNHFRMYVTKSLFTHPNFYRLG